MRRAVLAVTTIVLAFMTACSDHPNAPATAFDLTVRAVDQEGHPVQGLDLLLLMDSPYYQKGLAAKKAAVWIPFVVPYASHVTVSIEDAARKEVIQLSDGVLPAGSHQITWTGLDRDGAPCYSGLYYARMIGRNPAGAAVLDARRPMILGLLDFDQATIGTTDAAGEIVLRDRRLFPALYGDVSMQAVDEAGNVMGDFPLTHTMRFYLSDRVQSGAVRFDREVTATGQTIEVVWTAAAVPLAESALAAPAAEHSSAPAGGRAGAEPPKIEFALSQPYPNPFN